MDVCGSEEDEKEKKAVHSETVAEKIEETDDERDTETEDRQNQAYVVE